MENRSVSKYSRLPVKYASKNSVISDGKEEVSFFRTPKPVAILKPNSQWYTGPVDTKGIVFDASDRNVIGHLCAIGSADHGIKVFDILTGKLSREYGHTEWVTCLEFLEDGRIISGGMDSKICLWDKKMIRCVDLLEHKGSISQVKAGKGNVFISSSYDKNLIIWDGSKGKAVQTLKGHKEPILEFVWENGTVVSGDRGGSVRIWDTTTAACSQTLSGHKGQITSMSPGSPGIYFTGGMDGDFRVWEEKTGECIHRTTAHPGASVTAIAYNATTNTVITAGADKKIQVFDAKNGFSLLHSWTDHKDCIYSLKTIGNLCLSGGGNGWLLVHNIETGKCLYGLGANQHAVRCIEFTESKLVTAGDDGKAIIFDLQNVV